MNTKKNRIEELQVIENLLNNKGAKTRMKDNLLLFNFQGTPGTVKLHTTSTSNSYVGWLITHQKLSAQGVLNTITEAIEKVTNSLTTDVLLAKIIREFGENSTVQAIDEDKYEIIIEGVKVNILVEKDRIKLGIHTETRSIFTNSTDEEIQTIVNHIRKKSVELVEYYKICQEKIKGFRKLLKKQGVETQTVPIIVIKKVKVEFDKLYKDVDVNSICFYFKYRGIELIAETDTWNRSLIRIYKLFDVERTDHNVINISKYCRDEKDYQELLDELELNYEKFMYGSAELIQHAVDALVKEGHNIQTNGNTLILKYKDFVMNFSGGDYGINLKGIQHEDKNSKDSISQKRGEPAIVFIGDIKLEVKPRVFSSGTRMVPNKRSAYNYLLEHIQYIDTILEIVELIKNAKAKYCKFVLDTHFTAITLTAKFDYQDISNSTDNIIVVGVARSLNVRQWGVDRKYRYSSDYSFPTGDKCANVSEAKTIFAEHENDIKDGF